MSRPPRFLLASLLVLFVSLPVSADPPDSGTNPASGYIEVVDVVASGSSYHVRHTINPGQSQSLTVTELTTGSVNDVSPKLAFAANGDAWVTWWRDGSTKQVLVSKRTGGTWGSERIVSDSSQSARKPQILYDGTSAWVAYEYASGGSSHIAVGSIADGPEPIDPVTLSATSYTGDLSVRVQAASNHLWVSWVDSSSTVGWSEYDRSAGSWSASRYESYVSDTVAAARSRIQTSVLGN